MRLGENKPVIIFVGEYSGFTLFQVLRSLFTFRWSYSTKLMDVYQ